MTYLLVVGVGEGSLGAAIAQYARDRQFSVADDVKTAGPTGDADHYLDMDYSSSQGGMWELLKKLRPRHIVCTIGTSNSSRIDEPRYDYTARLRHAFEANVEWPLSILRNWYGIEQDATVLGPRHFVAISSNSAHIARRNSSQYCASKAALSMALRCVARELAETDFVVYGYEPGLLAGTPMTRATEGRFSGPLHRMPGFPERQGIHPASLARMVVANLHHGREINGSLFRVDAGEQ